MESQSTWYLAVPKVMAYLVSPLPLGLLGEGYRKALRIWMGVTQGRPSLACEGPF